MQPFIYLRGLRHVDHSVFCVENGQKFYWDPVFNNQVPYSSGQQVKRGVLSEINMELKSHASPVTFVFDLNNKGALGEGEVLSICDPQYYDQLFGGWMRAAKGGKERTLKRRSPFSISAMRAVHPLLAGRYQENATFDRSENPKQHHVIVRDPKGQQLDEAEINRLLEGTDRSLYRKWIPGNARATGLFIYDVAIDLRTLFCVTTNQLEPEITPEKIEELKSKGWIESKNAFGECLVMPKQLRDKAIPAIAKALVEWRITSNQARTFSLMETLAVAISQDPNDLAAAIRAKLLEETERPKAKLIIDANTDADIYVTLPCAAYTPTEIESATAIKDAEKKLEELLFAFDYENQ